MWRHNSFLLNNCHLWSWIHTSIKYRCLIKKSNWIIPAYRSVDHYVRRCSHCLLFSSNCINTCYAFYVASVSNLLLKDFWSLIITCFCLRLITLSFLWLSGTLSTENIMLSKWSYPSWQARVSICSEVLNLVYMFSIELYSVISANMFEDPIATESMHLHRVPHIASSVPRQKNCQSSKGRVGGSDFCPNWNKKTCLHSTCLP